MKQPILSKKNIHKAQKHLGKSDKVMASLISAHGPCPLGIREYRPFHTLMTSIIGQQLSAKASNTIENRVKEIIPSPFCHSDILAMDVEKLRGAGISRPKIRYIRELAERISDGRICFDERLKSKSDNEVIQELIEVPGIGKWTAEMFLIFGLRRPDVLSLGDAGLHRATKLLYNNNHSTDDFSLQSVSDVWRPYRSVASWYLWKHLAVVG